MKRENASNRSSPNAAVARAMPFDSKSSPSFRIGRLPKPQAVRQRWADSSGSLSKGTLGSTGAGKLIRSPSHKNTSANNCAKRAAFRFAFRVFAFKQARKVSGPHSKTADGIGLIKSAMGNPRRSEIAATFSAVGCFTPVSHCATAGGERFIIEARSVFVIPASSLACVIRFGTTRLTWLAPRFRLRRPAGVL